ncbi:hypothetical protein SeMB42_g06094 [Synchytrium endobioticum]|nr:hypothetical protein SeMB42_g06094 [Synchytrium endobioticum]
MTRTDSVSDVRSLSDINTDLYRDIVSCLIPPNGHHESPESPSVGHDSRCIPRRRNSHHQHNTLATPTLSRKPTFNASPVRNTESLVKTETFRVSDFIKDYKEKLENAENAATRNAQKTTSCANRAGANPPAPDRSYAQASAVSTSFCTDERHLDPIQCVLKLPVERTEDENNAILEMMSNMTAFKKLPKHVLHDAAKVVYGEHVIDGRAIVRQGEVGSCWYVLVRGNCSVCIHHAGSSKQEEVDKLHGGDSFGEMSLIYSMPRTATIVAMTPCDLIRLEKVDYDRIMRIVHEAETREKYDFILDLENFASWPSSKLQLTCNAFIMKDLEPSTLILEAQRNIMTFYIVKSGMAIAYRNFDDDDEYVKNSIDGKRGGYHPNYGRQVAILRKGDIIGGECFEQSLIQSYAQSQYRQRPPTAAATNGPAIQTSTSVSDDSDTRPVVYVLAKSRCTIIAHPKSGVTVASFGSTQAQQHFVGAYECPYWCGRDERIAKRQAALNARSEKWIDGREKILKEMALECGWTRK